MFAVSIGKYAVYCSTTYESMCEEYRRRARIVKLYPGDGEQCFFGINPDDDGWPSLVVIMHCYLNAGFHPGALIVPETDLLFLGAGENLVTFKLDILELFWEDSAHVGFWGWQRHDDVVIMSAELEIAAWDIEGRPLWRAFAEPPWSYSVNNGIIELDVTGKKSSFSLHTGPET